MPEESIAVYRRNKANRSDSNCSNSSGDRQRVIGGIGRRRNNANNAIQSRIQQFANAGGDDNNNAMTTIDTLKECSKATTLNGIISPSPRRRNRQQQPETHYTSPLGSKTPVITRRTFTTSTPPPSTTASSKTEEPQQQQQQQQQKQQKQQQQQIRRGIPVPKLDRNIDIKKNNNTLVNSNNDDVSNKKEDSNTSSFSAEISCNRTPTPVKDRGRRTSIATTTGTDHSKSFVSNQQMEPEHSLGQGSLLKSKQMKWEKLSTTSSNSSSKENLSILNGKERSFTPPLKKRAESDLGVSNLEQKSRNPINATVSTEKQVKSPISSSTEVSPTSSKTSLNDKEKAATLPRYRTKTSASALIEKVNSMDVSTKQDKVQSRAKVFEKSTEDPQKTIDKSLNQSSNQTKKESPTVPRQNRGSPPVVMAKPPKPLKPPPVLPKKIPHKKGSAIAALQNQLETNFDKPKTTREAEKKAATLRQQISALSPSTSMESIRQFKRHDVNNNETAIEVSDVKIAKTEISALKKISVDSTSSESSIKGNTLLSSTERNEQNKHLRSPSSQDLTKARRNNGSVPLDRNTRKALMSRNLKENLCNSDSSTPTEKMITPSRIENKSKDKQVETIPNQSERETNKTITDVPKINKNDGKSAKKVSEEKQLDLKSKKDNISRPEAVKIAYLRNSEEILKKANENITPGIKQEKQQLQPKHGLIITQPNNHDEKSSTKIHDKNFNRSDNRLIKFPDKLEEKKSTTDNQQITLKEPTDKADGFDNTDCTQFQSIANRFPAERNFTDQKESSQQKSRADDITVANKEVPTSCINRNVKNSFKLDSDNYASNFNNNHRLPPSRDRSNTWTTSDSDENGLFVNQEDSLNSESSCSSLNKKVLDERGRRRKLTKKRSKKSKVRPIVTIRHENKQIPAIDTSDGDILESNYTSDDRGIVSSGIESTLCDSDNFETCEESKIHTDTKLSNITSETEESSAPNISEKEFSESENLKSSSMTTISAARIKGLTSYSTTDMGSRSDNDSGSNLGNFSGIPIVPTKVLLQSFSSPLTNTYSERSSSSIKTNPFSLPTNKRERHSVSEHELPTQIKKLDNNNEDSIIQQPIFPGKTSSDDGYTRRTNSYSESADEVLSTLPSSPFTLLKRFTRDTQKMQSRSTGSLGISRKINDTQDVGLELISEHNDEQLNSVSSISKGHSPEGYLDTDDNIIDNTELTSKIKTRPQLNMPNKTTDESIDQPDKSTVNRRPSYIEATDNMFQLRSLMNNEHEDRKIDTQVAKPAGKRDRPKLPATMLNGNKRSDSDNDQEVPTSPAINNEDNDSQGEAEDIRSIFKDRLSSPTTPKSPLLGGMGFCVGEESNNSTRSRPQRLAKPKPIFPEVTIVEEPEPGDNNNNNTPAVVLEEEREDVDESQPSDNDNESETEVSDVGGGVGAVKPAGLLTTRNDSETGVNPKPLTIPDQAADKNQTLRRHVLQNLLETEKSYVENLGAMLTMFYNPLKRPENVHIIEPALVDEIFYQIPEILKNHIFFLEQLNERVEAWSDYQMIADIFISSFTKCLLMDAYSSFINNFAQAKAAIRQASSNPHFRRHVETCTKEKLTLSDLLIMPVQRIPRYVLILKDMLKFTPAEHPDYGNLQLALDEIKTLADRMNKGEVEADQAERDIERLRDIEANIEGITDLVTNNRKFIRQDLVAEQKGTITKKDRCLFLFSDLLVCTTVRRKTNIRRGSLGLFTGQSAAEFNRFKFIWKYPLDDTEISKVNNAQQNFGNEDIERLDEDIRTLNEILTMADRLSIPRYNLDAAIRDMLNEARGQIQERQNQSPPSTLSSTLTKMELQVQAEDTTEMYTFIFLSAECKSSWEAYFEDAKQKLAYSRDTFPPEFQYSTPITKTRSGMQFTCASPGYINGLGDTNGRMRTSGFVWICNSDGYDGQVCLLSMIPEAQPKASLSVCHSRISCIAVVPGARIIRGKSSSGGSANDWNKSMKSQRNQHDKKHFYDDDDFGAQNIIPFDSSGDEDSDLQSSYINTVRAAFGGRRSPDGSSLGAGESIEGERDESSDDSYSSDDEQEDSIIMGSTSYPTKPGLSGLNTDLDAQATMWLGTEDGHICVYNAQDAITQRKYITKRPLRSPVTSIIYFENKIFIALGRGELCIYKREIGGAWQLSAQEIIQVSNTASAIACMIAVAGRIWCGCQNTIVLVNATSLKIENTFSVNPDHNRAVHKIVSSGLGVWVSMQNSATVRLYHATTYENLLDIDVAPAVHKMLAGADAIIRQHKAACLRVTSLLICKDLLWVGTSAGVILTNPLPSITASTSVLRHSIGPTGSPHGHTGHVRFLTSVEVPKATFKGSDYDSKDSARILPTPGTGRMKRKDTSARTQKSIDSSDTTGTVTLVVSGGDGHEDFRYNQQSETVGRDDSTNHLLVWRV